MELNHQEITTPVRAAATLVMLRDAPGGLEVFLIRRHGLSDVLGGAYVFPGGKVDDGDALLDMASHLDDQPQRLHAVLGEPQLDARSAAGIYVTALREGRAFGDMVAQLQLRLAASQLTPWTRWITPRVPSVMNKRFDTRFFVAAAPAGQLASHDNHEATESVWLRPRAALQQYWDRAIELAPPQIMSLAQLSRHDSVASVLAQARGRLPPVIQPEPFELDGTRILAYPGDPRHPVADRAMPGPTRLHFRNKRFEPAEGFDGLFA